MTIEIAQLQTELSGLALPGGAITIEALESLAVDHSTRAEPGESGVAHPIWLVILSLRGLGVSIERLGELAHQREGDTLLYGGVDVVQLEPLRIGETYDITAVVTSVERKTMGSGGHLDFVVIDTDITGASGHAAGNVTSNYLFKRWTPS